MKKILIFLIVFAILFKKGLLCFIPVQSLFFVLSLKKHSTCKTKKAEAIAAIFKGALFIVCGYVFSLILLLYAEQDVYGFFDYALLSSVVFTLYLCFYFLILLIVEKEKFRRSCKGLIVLCAVLPCFSYVKTDISINPLLPFMLLGISTILMCMSLYAAHKKNIGR